MLRPRLFVSCGLILVLTISIGSAPPSPTLDEIVEQNTKAMGGRAAIEALQNVEMNLYIVEPGFAADAIYRAARPGQMRIDVNVNGKHAVTEAFDGKNAWQQAGNNPPKPESPKGAAALRRGVELPGKVFGLHELKSRGHQLELIGREKIEGTDYYALRLALADGYNTTLYVDPTSWLITRRRDVRPLHVDVDPTPTTIEQVSSDFRQIAGVQFPFLSIETDLKTGKELSRATIRTIKVNVPLDQTIFEKP
jgi:hypothetical protein